MHMRHTPPSTCQDSNVLPRRLRHRLREFAVLSSLPLRFTLVNNGIEKLEMLLATCSTIYTHVLTYELTKAGCQKYGNVHATLRLEVPPSHAVTLVHVPSTKAART